jgi:hypothetical protein
VASKPPETGALAAVASASVRLELPNRSYLLTSVTALTRKTHLTLVPADRAARVVSDAMLCNVGVANAIASTFGTFDGGTCSAKVPVQATPERVANLLARHRLLLIDLGPPVPRVDTIVSGPRPDEIAELPMSDKALRVVRAMTELPVEDWRVAFGDAGIEALNSLKEPQTLATLAFVFAIWAFAQTNPAGWIMDAALIGIAVVSLGLQIFGWIGQLEDCLTAIATIKTPEDEKQAAKALLKVIGRLGIDVLITLLTRAAGKTVKATAKPPVAKPPGGGTSPSPVSPPPKGSPKLPKLVKPNPNPAVSPVIPKNWVSKPGREAGSTIYYPPGTNPAAKGATFIRVMPPGRSPVPGLSENGYWVSVKNGQPIGLSGKPVGKVEMHIPLPSNGMPPPR